MTDCENDSENPDSHEGVMSCLGLHSRTEADDKKSYGA